MPIPTYYPTPQPMYAQPTSAPQAYAPQQYPAPSQPYAPAPAAAGTGWQHSPVLAAQAPQNNQVKARGYAPEAKPSPQPPAAPKTIQLPTPEELGLKSPAREASPTPPATAQAKVAQAKATPEPVDWNQTHARLRELGAIGFHLDHLAGGITRVRTTMPDGRLVEAIASSDAAAIATMFDRANVR